MGVDILLFPVEEKAPSPSDLPMPNFGVQRMEIAGDFQPPAGRDVPSVTVDEQGADLMEDQQDRRDCDFEESSSSSNTKTSEIHSGEDSDRSIKLQAKPKARGRTPKGSVGVALEDKRRRQNMLGAVELASAMQVEPSSDTSDASILYDMADQAVNLAASRAGWQTRTEQTAPRTAYPAPRTSLLAPASSCKAAPLPPPPPPPPPPPDRDRVYSHCSSEICWGCSSYNQWSGPAYRVDAVQSGGWSSQCQTQELAAEDHHEGSAAAGHRS